MQAGDGASRRRCRRPPCTGSALSAESDRNVTIQSQRNRPVWLYLLRIPLPFLYGITLKRLLRSPRSSGVPTKHFWPIGCGPSIPGAAAAHAWVRVPPFVVADLTLAMQEYSEGEERLLPDTVLAEDASPGAVALSDLLDPEARAELARHVHGQPEVGDVRLVDVGLLDRIRKFGVWDLQHKGTRIRYVACAVSAPDGPMESAKNLQLSGKYMIKLWHQFEKVARPPTGPT